MPRDLFAYRGTQLRQHASAWRVGNGIHVAHGNRKSDANAKVIGSTRHFTRLADRIGESLRPRVMDHDGAHTTTRGARQRHTRSQPGINLRGSRDDGVP